MHDCRERRTLLVHSLGLFHGREPSPVEILIEIVEQHATEAMSLKAVFETKCVLG